MCKHILFNNFDPAKDIDTLRIFTELTHDRDGFGAIMRDSRGNITTLKSLNIGSFYIDLMTLIASSQVSTLVVHHRTSTNGMGLDYSHPFEYQGHYLTHNGVVSVPDRHETLTTNDSEALLHHLIKTNYNTLSISGYFSCFILNKDTTTILVDNTAPLYVSNDSRVYSSHALEGFTKISLKKITLSSDGYSSEDIQVSKNSYGMDRAHISIGDVYPHFKGSDFSYTRNVDTFFACLTYREEDELLYFCRDKNEMKREVAILASQFGIKLSKNEVGEILMELNKMKAW